MPLKVFFYSFIAITLIAFVTCNDPLDKLSELKTSDVNENNQETNQEQANINNQVNERSELLLTGTYMRLARMIEIIKSKMDILNNKFNKIYRAFKLVKQQFHSMPFSRFLSRNMKVIDKLVTELERETNSLTAKKELGKAINIIKEIDPNELNDDLKIIKDSLKRARMSIHESVMDKYFVVRYKNLVFKLSEEINERNISRIDIYIARICNLLKRKMFTRWFDEAKKAVERLLI